MITEPGSLRDVDCTLRSHCDFRFDEVLDPIARAGGNVPGQCVTGQSGYGNVVCPTDATFEHASAPIGNNLAEAVGLDFACAGKAAHAAEFDVDDAAGS